MATLQQLVESSRCRKGTSEGTTKRGAFWRPCQPITIRKAGGDGIGNSGADVDFSLDLRHYRDGTVQALVVRSSWHQNHGSNTSTQGVANVLKCETVEEVIAAIKGTDFRRDEYEYSEHVFSDYYTDALTEALVALGLTESLPAPDED